MTLAEDGGHHPRGSGPPASAPVGASTLECGATACPPRSLGDRVCPGSPLGRGAWCPLDPTLAQPGLGFRWGQGEGCGRLGRKHIGFLQCHRSDPCGRRPAGGLSRAAGALPGLAVATVGPAGPHHRPVPTYRHFREKQRTAWGLRTLSPSPPRCQLPSPVREAQGSRWPSVPADSCVGLSVGCHLSFP